MSLPKKINQKLPHTNLSHPGNHDTISSFQIANGLRVLRKANGHSLHDLQDITAIHRYALSAYEQNIIEPSGTDVFVIVSTLGMPIDDFYQFAKTFAKHTIEDDLAILVEKQKIKKHSLFDTFDHNEDSHLLTTH